MLTAKALGEGMSVIQRKMTKYNSEKQIEKMVSTPHVSILWLQPKLPRLPIVYNNSHRLYLYHSYGQYIFILINRTCLPDFLTFFKKYINLKNKYNHHNYQIMS